MYNQCCILHSTTQAASRNVLRADAMRLWTDRNLERRSAHLREYSKNRWRFFKSQIALVMQTEYTGPVESAEASASAGASRTVKGSVVSKIVAVATSVSNGLNGLKRGLKRLFGGDAPNRSATSSLAATPAKVIPKVCKQDGSTCGTQQLLFPQLFLQTYWML